MNGMDNVLIFEGRLDGFFFNILRDGFVLIKGEKSKKDKNLELINERGEDRIK